MRADRRKENKPEIVRPTNVKPKMGECKGHICPVLRETEEVEAEISEEERKKEVEEERKKGVEVEISEEARRNKGLPHGYKPSQKEIEEHERTHIPFRSWCKHCVFGKGQSHPHYAKDKEEEGMPCISWDYMYMKGDGSKYEEEEVENEMPIVVWKDSASKAEGAFVVPEKGNNEYAIRRGAQDVNKILGYTE